MTDLSKSRRLNIWIGGLIVAGEAPFDKDLFRVDPALSQLLSFHREKARQLELDSRSFSNAMQAYGALYLPTKSEQERYWCIHRKEFWQHCLPKHWRAYYLKGVTPVGYSEGSDHD